MPNLIFITDLNHKDKEGLIPIKANISIGKTNYRKTIARAKPRYWDEKTKKFKKPKKTETDKRWIEIYEKLEYLKKNSESFFKYCTLNNIPITDKILLEILNGRAYSKNPSCDLNKCFLEFIEEGRSSKSPGTVQTYTSAYNYLTKYQKYANADLTFKDMNVVFYDKFKYYAQKIKKSQDNTFAANITIIKTFLKWAGKRKYHSETEWIEDFKAPWTENEVVFLTIEELEILCAKTFENRILDRTRDAFCLECFTSLRFSDIKQLTRDHIQNGYIEKMMQKVKTTVRIPIHPAAQRILEKYDHPVKIFKGLRNNHYNISIKKCCELAGINQPTLKITRIGNETSDVVKPKCKLITSHTARRTFVTLCFANGMDAKTIKSMTGHTTDKSFDKYLKVADEMKKSKLNEVFAKFDKNPPPTEIEKLNKRIEELEKFIESQISNNRSLTE
ncbi:MAG TPA: site-specific integrase [Prolixibacteraceae bacterium]|nr:site-specific integrase [Prolixibacteraceae bacterium]